MEDALPSRRASEDDGPHERLSPEAAAARSAPIVPTLLNLRDLGGYVSADGRRIRRGRLFRSSAPGRHAVEAEAFAALGLRTICDFRSAGERAATPTMLPAESGTELGEFTIVSPDGRPLRPAYRFSATGSKVTVILRQIE